MKAPPKGMLRKRLFAMLVLAGMAFPVFSQSLAHGDQSVSLHADNETLLSILQDLSSLYDLNLSYNSSDEQLNSRVSYQAHHRPLLTVLQEILALVHYEFTPIGNQLVVHRSERFETMTGEGGHASGQQRPDTVLRIIEIPVVVRDTLVLYDTIREVVYRQQPFTTSVRPLIVSRPAFRHLQVRNNQWSFSLSYAQMLAGFREVGPAPQAEGLEKVREAEDFSFRNFILSGAAHYRSGALVLSSALSLNRFSTPFSYSELFTSGGYHLVDTLDSFYTIVDGEEVWVHITDSTYVPLETTELLYERMNGLGILEVQLNAAYDVFISDQLSLFAHGGLQAGMPVWLRGNAIQDEQGYPTVTLDNDEVSRYLFGYHVGAGARTRASSRLDLVFSATYKRYGHELFRSHPLSRRLHGVALQAGIQYHL